jgi:hypothetical protein
MGRSSALPGVQQTLILIHLWERHQKRTDIAVSGTGIMRPDTRVLFTPERTCSRR